MQTLLLVFSLIFVLDPSVKTERSLGHHRVAKAMQMVSHGYVAAIADAIDIVDPMRSHEWLERELYRICLRESRCGQYGKVGKHAADGWTGEASYYKEVQRGRLEPDTCEGHALNGRTLADYGTRGGWGVNAARGIARHLVGCHAPEELDDPSIAALVAARMLVGCKRGNVACTCSQRAALWIGAGTLARRPLWSFSSKSRVSSVASHCGDRYAAVYGFTQLVTTPARWVRRHLL